MLTSAPMNRIRIPAGFWEGLNQLGITTHDIARQTSMPVEVTAKPDVTVAQYYAIWQAYAHLIGGTEEAITKLVTVFETAKYPPSILATYHARDYRDALVRMARYKQMCPPEGLCIEEAGEDCTIELTWQHTEYAGPPVLVGITLACLLELGRRGTTEPLTAKRVEFSQKMGDVKALEGYFGCPIRTDAPCNRLTLHRRDLDRPFVSYNEELLAILTPALDKSLDEHESGRSLKLTVKWIIKRSLTGGRPDVHLVAKQLGMSNRTLQRRLADEHISFKGLVTQAKHELARELLADPVLDIKEVAFLIGYEDQNSFYRAFRLWEGETPANWRERHGRHAADSDGQLA